MALRLTLAAIWSRRWSRRLLLLGAFALIAGAVCLRPLPDTPEGEAALRHSFANLERAASDSRLLEQGPFLLAAAAKRELVREHDEGVPLGGNPGFFLRRRADAAAPESVWVRAVAFRQGERRAVLLSADVLVVHPALVDRVLELVRGDLDLTRGELFFVATHTHNGPGGYWKGFLPSISLGRHDDARFEFLAARCAEAVRAAFAAVVPVNLSHGEIDVGLPIAHRVDPYDGVENSSFALVRLEALDGSFVIDLVNYSAHPTALLREEDLLSGDYPGVLAHRLEDERRTVVFTPGTLGDQRPSNPLEGPKAINIAEHLESEGWQRVALREANSPRLQSFEFEVQLPAIHVRAWHSSLTGSWCLRDWLAAVLLPGDLSTTTVQVLRLGPVVFLGAPCDLASSVGLPLIEYGRQLGLVPIFASMTDDWIGYVLTEDEYFSSYKTNNQFHGPTTGALFAELYTTVLDRLASGF